MFAFVQEFLEFLEFVQEFHKAPAGFSSLLRCISCELGADLAVNSPHCPKDLGLHNFLVAAAQGALEPHIPHQPLPVGRESKVQHSAFMPKQQQSRSRFWFLLPNASFISGA